MTLIERLAAFKSIGHQLQNMSADEKRMLAERVAMENGWFTAANVSLAIDGLLVLIEPVRLEKWALNYTLSNGPSKTVGVAMAGNIPLVGFHDFLCVLVAGHKLRYKPSSKDTVLIDFIHQKLASIEPRFSDRLERSDRLNGVDAIIATGSDNTSRYFEYYFRNVPHIVRKNRVSCAVIQGDEPDEEISRLGHDIFSYFGLGCRNVATLFVPRNYDTRKFLERLRDFSHVLDNHKYANNYTYQKSLLMLNQERFLDNGFLLMKESDKLLSPVATLHYAFYNDQTDLKNRIASHRDKLQLIVSAQGWYEGSIPFGSAQFPKVDDYADGIDTMKFLSALK